MSEIHQLVPGKSDAEIAADLKIRVLKAWEPLLVLMDEAMSHGFNIQVQAGKGGLGKCIIHSIVLSKIFE